MRLNLIRRRMTRRANHQTTILDLRQPRNEIGPRQVRNQATQKYTNTTECRETGKGDSTSGFGATGVRFLAINREVVDADEEEGLREYPVERCAHDDEWDGPFVGELEEICASLVAVGFGNS